MINLFLLSLHKPKCEIRCFENLPKQMVVYRLVTPNKNPDLNTIDLVVSPFVFSDSAYSAHYDLVVILVEKSRLMIKAEAAHLPRPYASFIINLLDVIGAGRPHDFSFHIQKIIKIKSCTYLDQCQSCVHFDQGC